MFNSKRVFSLLILTSSIVAALFVADARGRDTKTFVIIGTGSVSGVYYPAGGAICRVVNQEQANLRCLVQSTGGAIDNIEALRAGELQFGIAQSDSIYHAFHGTERFSKLGAFEDLRAVFPEIIIERSEV